MSVIQTASDLIKRHEKLVLREYTDTTGNRTIGWGRNITAKGISEDEAELMFKNDFAEVENDLIKNIPWIVTLSENRQSALLDMCFNLGIHGLLEFKEMLSHIHEGNFEFASQCMRASKWSNQVHGRCDDDAFLIEKG